MLQAIRDKAQGWIAWAIVILISVPFALWGIQEYLGVGGETTVAEVDGQPITEQALDEQTRQGRENLRANLGDAYRADLFPDAMLRAQTLDRMIDEQVMQMTADEWGMRASDQMVVNAIRSEAAFQTNGKFDNELYKLVLRNNAMSQSAYDASVRHGLTLRQLQRGIAGSGFATVTQVERYMALRDQRRTLSYAVVPADKFVDGINPDDAAVAAYYAANQTRFQVPERVKLDYLLLDVESLANQIKADPQVVEAWYQQHRDEFVAPEERRLRHILITASGDEVAAKAKAEALRAKLAEGADFAELAKTESADPGSADKGGELGWVSRGMMVDAFEKAAFELPKGAISQPVQSPFGYHIIQVEDVRGGGDSDFAQVAEKATDAYRKAEAERLFFERAERLAELAYENPDNLEQPADALGLTIRHSDWIDASGGSGDLASPKVTAAAFSEDVLVQGHNSEMLELGPEKLLVLRIAEHQQTRVRPLDEVRDQVITALRAEKAAEAAKVAGEKLLADAKSAADLGDLAEQQGWTWKADVTTSRDQSDVPSAIRDRVFTLPHPTAGSNPMAGTELATGDYAVLALTTVTDGDPAKLDDAGRKLLAGRLASLQGSLDMASVVQALRERADVTVHLESAAPETSE